MILAILAAATLVANPNVPTEAYSAPVGLIPAIDGATPAPRPALPGEKSTKDSAERVFTPFQSCFLAFVGGLLCVSFLIVVIPPKKS